MNLWEEYRYFNEFDDIIDFYDYFEYNKNDKFDYFLNDLKSKTKLFRRKFKLNDIDNIPSMKIENYIRNIDKYSTTFSFYKDNNKIYTNNKYYMNAERVKKDDKFISEYYENCVELIYHPYKKLSEEWVNWFITNFVVINRKIKLGSFNEKYREI
jgi:hypothetical protein